MSRSSDSTAILTIELRFEHDLVLARQRARQLAGLLGFDAQDQTRIATAVSEIARNAYKYAGGGKVQFLVQSSSPGVLLIRVQDSGPGISNVQAILDGQYRSRTGMGLGIIGAKRLMDQFEVESAPRKGTTVLLGKQRSPKAAPLSPQTIADLTDQLIRSQPQDPFEELQNQNQELLRTMDELRQRQAELAQLNRELEDTNRGVVALYAELDERADYLRRASDLKSRFLSNMTHEFRTPLNSIMSLTYLLADGTDGKLSVEQEKQVAFIRKSAEDLSELVNDLLDLAKVEAGKVVIRPQPFEVANLFGALRGMLRPMLAANSSVSMVFEEPTGIPVMDTDEAKVSQILRNFISNAIKFTERGEVRVSAYLDSKTNTVTFAVADTGIGIAPENQDKVFQEYGQVENKLQAKLKGTGLGLPLSKRLAQLLGGDLSLISEPGKGSTFYATIPVKYAGPQEVAYTPEVRKDLDPTRLPVLVIEDNKETLFIYEKYLKNTGYQLIPARTLTDARQRLRQFRPVAIVLDILLEGENTWTFLSEVKGNTATRDIPVFVVSVVENQMKAKALGADAYHVKPVNRNWLLAQLKLATGGRSADRILVVDDDEISRYLLTGLLADTRFGTIEATGGLEGLKLAAGEQPKAIFLDINMPDLDGFAALEKLKANPLTRDIPVVVYTSRILTEQERQQLANNAVAILPKANPSREVAMDRIREAMARAGLRAGGAAATEEADDASS
ncbi:MAG: ATP-binding protein [Bacillota bacterium]